MNTKLAMKLNKLLIVIFSVLVVSIFIFTRLYNIKNGLFFFNDLGRDADVLYTWQKTGKPPLLGPQTSALPINQSPVYFYWLMIFYLLIRSNPIYSILAYLVFYLTIFFFGIIVFKKNNKLIGLWLGSYFLMAIDPQYIIQSRYVWNPSFASPFILLSIFFLYQSINKKKTTKVFLSAFFLSGAIAFSFSIAPLFLVYLIFLIFYDKEKIIKFLFSFIISLVFFFLPVIFFELRHNFLLTTSLLFKSYPKQQDLDFFIKFNSLSNYLLGTQYLIFNKIILTILFSYSFYQFLKNKEKPKISFFYFLFFTLIILTFIIPITVQAHYIFAISVILFLILFFEKKLVNLIILFILCFFYLLQIITGDYFKNSPRTYNQINQCFHQFCQTFKKPIYVSAVSNFHPYHYGPEHRYLLKKNGCLVKNIEENQMSTDTMMVVLDSADFNENVSYYELDLFGPYQKIKKHYCRPNFGYVLIRRLTKDK